MPGGQKDYLGCRMGFFHITTREDWAAAADAGVYRPDSLAAEGFIHLSNERQWLATANRFYRGRSGLVLLCIDPGRLHARVVLEPADGDLFPHLYGALNLDAVVDVFDLPVQGDGTIGVPERMKNA
jgi:uncharacterized protein (DUF952 family)